MVCAPIEEDDYLYASMMKLINKIKCKLEYLVKDSILYTFLNNILLFINKYVDDTIYLIFCVPGGTQQAT